VAPSFGPTPVNLSHDLLSPSNCIRNCADRCRNSRAAFVLSKLSCCKNTGSDQQNALAALVHRRSLALSPFLRYICR
jgi:hypothetical protein